jgi:hypothetical protein
MHFSDKISYKILFISSYQSKGMNCARFKYLQEYLERENRNWARPEPEWRQTIAIASRQWTEKL